MNIDVDTKTLINPKDIADKCNRLLWEATNKRRKALELQKQIDALISEASNMELVANNLSSSLRSLNKTPSEISNECKAT